MDGIERAAPDRRTARFDRASPATRAGVGDGRDAIRFATIAAASARARGPGPDRPARAALPSPRKQTRALRSRSRCEARRRNRSAAPRATFACGTYRRATLARATTGRTAAADMVMADILRESVRAKMGPLARIRPSSPAPDSSRSHEDSPSSVSASLADQRARDWCERSERFSPPIPGSFSAAVFFCTRSRHGRLETEKAPPLMMTRNREIDAGSRAASPSLSLSLPSLTTHGPPHQHARVHPERDEVVGARHDPRALRVATQRERRRDGSLGVARRLDDADEMEDRVLFFFFFFGVFFGDETHHRVRWFHRRFCRRRFQNLRHYGTAAHDAVRRKQRAPQRRFQRAPRVQRRGVVDGRRARRPAG